MNIQRIKFLKVKFGKRFNSTLFFVLLMRKLVLALLLIALVGVVGFGQTSISANPLYLSLLIPFTVFNVINITYVGIHVIPSNVSLATYDVVANSYIKIIIVNFTTQQQIASLTAYIPPQYAKYVYYSPQLGSVFFLINVSSDKQQTISISDLNIPAPAYNVTGGVVTSVTIIPLGYLVLANGTPVNETTVFLNYLNGTAVVHSMIEGLAGYYVLYYVS